MMWNEWGDYVADNEQNDQDSHVNFDFLSALLRPKDYYKILEVDYDATDDAIRSNYIRLALRWHPDKQKDQQDSATSRFQAINEAYQEGDDGLNRPFRRKCTSFLNNWRDLVPFGTIHQCLQGFLGYRRRIGPIACERMCTG
ncbi:hypothetical protein CJ030_MR8G020766 [Morella rubra]|uniref:J domain-containing protein n=1 Tax=Morella rubra TaxID=262757 RepID=A0A6A1UU92_9ROSI|nr:hypothetical protein CJ030_MR8G020766 [Morella rubra]